MSGVVFIFFGSDRYSGVYVVASSFDLTVTSQPVKRLAYLILPLLCLSWPRAYAQPLKGMVWDPPASTTRAAQDLLDMRAMGVEAVRTPLLKDEALYALADSLGLTLFQDLNFDYLPAQTLLDTLDYARQVIQEAAWWAEKHPSARYFGLARHSDTSDPAACAYIRELADAGRSRLGNTGRFYYITSYIEDERCVEDIDMVMIDALDVEAPAEMLMRWHQAHGEGPLAISALGAWVDRVEEDEDGYERRHSPSFQARYLEMHVTDLLEAHAHLLGAVFVYRWRDRRLDFPSPAQNLKFPYRHTYGLNAAGGVKRPSFAVVRGIYTGTQKVFAFPAGKAVSVEIPWITILGWLNVALLAFGISHFPRLRPTLARYFTAHGFYRDSVAEGRELLFRPNILLLFALMLSFSVTMAVILEGVRMSEAFTALVRWMPESMRETTILLLGNQPVLLILFSSAYAVAVAIWTSVLSAASARSRRLLLPGQAFMLVVWSQWIMLLMLPVAMVVSTVNSAQAPLYALVLFVLHVLGMTWANIRTLRDFSSITRANPVQFAIAFWGNPFWLVLLVGVYLCYLHGPKFAFFWHLIVRS